MKACRHLGHLFLRERRQRTPGTRRKQLLFETTENRQEEERPPSHHLIHLRTVWGHMQKRAGWGGEGRGVTTACWWMRVARVGGALEGSFSPVFSSAGGALSPPPRLPMAGWRSAAPRNPGGCTSVFRCGWACAVTSVMKIMAGSVCSAHNQNFTLSVFFFF